MENPGELLGTLVVPGGLLPAIFLALGGGWQRVEVTLSDPLTGEVLEQASAGGPSPLAQVLLVVHLVALVVGRLATTAYLSRGLARGPRRARLSAG